MPVTAPAPATHPEPELLGEAAGPVEAVVRAARRDILGTAAYDLPIEANTWVEAELDFLVEQRREVIALWLARGAPYELFIKENLAASGVPTDLYHLAMIESGFVPTAKSRAGAVGFWQFMPATARALGLRVDTLVDERMDPVRSTRAAARHLRGLKREMGDWALAAAAYNAGTGRIGRGLKALGAADFWDLAQRGDLAAETRRYVPRLYAVTVIGRARERFGFKNPPAPARFAFDSIQVEFATPLAELAKLGASAEQLLRLNPHLVHGTTPAHAYWVWVPAGMGVALQRAWLASDFRKDQGYGSYTVRKGDTLGELADLADIPSSRIRELNARVDLELLQIGEKLRLPYQVAKRLETRSPGSASTERTEPARTVARELAKSADAEKPSTSPTHRVAHGETLGGIARQYGSTVAQLREANDLEDDGIRADQVLRIPSAAKSQALDGSRKTRRDSHLVKTGESLWGIARRYGSTVQAIREANELDDRPLQPGQLLAIPPAE